MQLRPRIALTLATLVAVSSIASAQTIYEWRSDDGERNYSDMPPDTVVAEETGLNITPTNPSLINASQTAKRAQQQEQGALDQISKEDADAQAEVVRQETAQRADNCSKARQTLNAYNNSRRVYKKGENGEVEWLDIDQERATAQEAVDTWCN
jgi:hypothetical protein